jgi:hypothetical protein
MGRASKVEYIAVVECREHLPGASTLAKVRLDSALKSRPNRVSARTGLIYGKSETPEVATGVLRGGWLVFYGCSFGRS